MTLAQIPDCKARPPIEALDARQRAELIRLLAEKGPQALEAWLKEEARRDPSVRARLERHRARLERSARAEAERIQAAGQERRKANQSVWERRAAEQMRREEELRQRIARAGGAAELSLDAMQLLEAGDTSPLGARSGTPSRWRLAWHRFWGRIALFFAHLQGLLRPSLRKNRHVRIGRDDVDLDQMARQRPEVLAAARRQARKRPFWQRFVSWWRRLFGLEDALDDLRRMLETQAHEARRRGVLMAQEMRTEAELGLQNIREEGQRDAETRRRELDELEAAQRQAERELRAKDAEAPYRTLTEEVLGELSEAGLVDAAGAPTERLLQRFSSMLFEEAVRGAAEGGPASPGTYQGGEGEYERGAMASLQELGAMELVDTLLRARMRHPHVRHIQDDDVIVHRETRSARAHVVVIFDHSNSMEENDRLEAAKRVCLVLHKALREDDPDHRIDLVAMGTSVRRVDLAQCWASTPSGFTNQGAALREARRLLETSEANRRLVYMVTDGLPEARTLPDGRDVADRVDACMPDALKAAKQLHDMGGVRLLILQLETSDPKYLEAARKVAKAGGGRVVGLDPKELSKTLLVDLRAATKAPVLAA